MVKSGYDSHKDESAIFSSKLLDSRGGEEDFAFLTRFCNDCGIGSKCAIDFDLSDYNSILKSLYAYKYIS